MEANGVGLVSCGSSVNAAFLLCLFLCLFPIFLLPKVYLAGSDGCGRTNCKRWKVLLPLELPRADILALGGDGRHPPSVTCLLITLMCLPFLLLVIAVFYCLLEPLGSPGERVYVGL